MLWISASRVLLSMQARWIEFSLYLTEDILDLSFTRRFLADSNAFKSHLEDIRVIWTLYKTTIDFKSLKKIENICRSPL